MSHNHKSKKNNGLSLFTVSEAPFSQDNRFDGNKLHFSKLMKEIETAVRCNAATAGYVDYVTETFKQLKAKEGDTTIRFKIPDKFSLSHDYRAMCGII